ncbi:MAG TPA: hypothetical protein PLZ52_10385 [Bacteroidales bacterium]|nr:hypothetical protein [Bacteroidales bacterium]
MKSINLEAKFAVRLLAFSICSILAGAQTTHLLPKFNMVDYIELDQFLHAIPLTGATQYEFWAWRNNSSVNENGCKDELI